MNKFINKGSVRRIVVMGIIIFIVLCAVQYISFYIKREKTKNLQADLLLIQAKVEIVKTNNEINKEENPLKGYVLTELPDDINIKTFLEKNIILEEEYAKYYLLDSESLEQMGLQDLKNTYNGYFIVNYENYEVIYTEGYENENKLWVYRLSELHKTPESDKKSEGNGEQNNEQDNELNNEQNSEQM